MVLTEGIHVGVPFFYAGPRLRSIFLSERQLEINEIAREVDISLRIKLAPRTQWTQRDSLTRREP